jgi:hypothetical protein
MLARRPESAVARRTASLRTLAGLVAAGLTLGAAATVVLHSAGDWVAPGVAEAASGPTQVPLVPAGVKQAPPKNPVNAAPAAKTPAPVASTTKAPAAPAVKAVAKAPAAKSSPVPPTTKPAMASPAKAVTPIVAASARPTVSTVKPAPKATIAPPATHMEEQLTYQYNALGRRDPFQSLIGGGFVGDDVGGDAPPDIGGIKVVGIVWGTNDKFALVEDARGNSLVLRQGDKVMNGVVQGLKRDAVVVQLTVDNQSQTVTIPLTRKGDNSNANR